MAHETTDNNFSKDVLESSQPVLVDFWAEWCGPCKQLAPVLEEVSRDLADKVKVLKVNVDHNPDSPVKYNVRGIPTLILFKDGQVVATKVGSLPKAALIDWINNSLAA